MTVTVCAREEETAALLATVLDGDQTAAALLAKAIHQDLQLRDQAAEGLQQLPVNAADVGIWIDPIGEQESLVTLRAKHGCLRVHPHRLMLQNIYYFTLQYIILQLAGAFSPKQLTAEEHNQAQATLRSRYKENRFWVHVQ